jgi:CRISPR-associated exonuclease Cas4
MPGILVFVLALGILLVWLGRRQRAAAGLPEGRIVSQDVLGRARPGETLYDAVLDLAGRPDYLVEIEGRLIPIEIKSGRAHAGPRRSHRLQVAAYCRLVEAVHARRPPYGILRYADRSYAIPYTGETDRELAGVLDAMRLVGGEMADRSHESPARCRGCSFRETCDQGLI